MAFDIEHFPTSDSAKRMLSRVSPIYDNSYVGKWLFEVMGLEIDEAWQLINDLKAQCFIDTVTWGIQYFEQMYGVTGNEDAPIEERRAAVRRRMTRMASVTPAMLENILEALTDREIDVEEDNPHYQFTINIGEGGEAVDYTAIIERVNTIKPSHLCYSINLPRKGKLTMTIGVAMYEVREIKLTTMDNSGFGDISAFVDENGDFFIDEDGTILIDRE